MKQLSGLDAAFLYLETPEMPMHVGALHILELPPGHRGRFVNTLRRHIAGRLPKAPVLRRRLWWMPLNLANPSWVDAEPELSVHIVEVKLPASARKGSGLPELQAAVGELHSVLLDRSRPLWKMHVFEGLAPGPNGRRRVALYTQLHHAAVDGQAAVALAGVLLDVQPLPPQAAPARRAKAKVAALHTGHLLRGAIGHQALLLARVVKELPTSGGALALAARLAWRGRGLIKAGASEVSNLTLAPRTSLNVTASSGRAFAALTLPLQELRDVGRTQGATLNDMVLWLCSTALRRYFGLKKALPRKSLVAAVPVSLREKGDTTADNQASMSLMSLGTHLADPHKRLAHIKAASASMKGTINEVKRLIPTDFPSIGLPWVMEGLTALYGKARAAERLPLVANLVISNVPGPPVPLYLAGAQMLTNYPASIVTHGMGLNITVQSYSQSLDIGLMADAQAMPDVQLLADGLQRAFEELQAWQAEPEASTAELARGTLKAARTLLDEAVGAVAEGFSRGVRRRAGSALGTVASLAVKGAVGSAMKATARKPAARRTPGKRP